MKLYNTLTKKIDEVTPRENMKINMFVCGPTVYDYSHLGHAKTYTQMDVLARTLKASGYNLRYIQNITDIDDKIIVRAKENNESFSNLALRFEEEYMQDMKSLNNTSVDEYPRATDYIDQIIKQVQTLIESGHAYTIENDGIYFEISTFEDYGKLSGRKDIKENDAQTRIDESDNKKGWNDFCLWKFSKPEEPTWEAPFGNGRPGWHIEDTAITESFFGPQYDIHGGAIDLIFPHHEAEITQMESASGLSPFVNTWVHTGFLQIDNSKMSKSLKNFYTIREVLAKGYDPRALRLFILQSHYRSSVNFSFENLDMSVNRLRNLKMMSDQRFQPNPKAKDISSEIDNKAKDILKSLQEDLNTPEALASISYIENLVTQNGLSNKSLNSFVKFLNSINELLGINLTDSEDITDAQKTLISERILAKKNQNWEKSDQIRTELEENGILLKDTAESSMWYRR